MKTYKLLFTLLLTFVLGVVSSLAQERVVIPLSNPGEPGQLELGIVRGSISVVATDGEEVVINYSSGESRNDSPQEKNGLRRISDSSVGFEVTENDNEIEIGGASPHTDVNFSISVPRNFSLYLSTVNGGDVNVEGVRGEMEISNVNGDVTLSNVGGSASVNTVNGDIAASFNSIGDNPMAFTTVQGDIDITLPANAKVTAKMRSEWGEVYTDFEMNIDRSNRESIEADSDVYKVSVNNWINGRINGGGPEYMFKTLRGDIYIRKQ